MTKQTSLFPERINILPYDGDVFLYENFFTETESDNCFENLRKNIQWRQEPIKIFGKEVMQPRLTAWYGDTDKAYSYSGITMHALPWTESLNEIRKKIEPIAEIAFTSALLNFYRDGKDSMGWHRDNEKELGPTPFIGSVSFGASRIFQFRNYKNKKEKISLILSHGSLLLMHGTTNDHWEHQLPKTSTQIGERINITFRTIC